MQTAKDRDPVMDKIQVLQRYYELVRKGCSPEQTREDLMLSIEDIAGFDFSVFEKKGKIRP